MLHLKNMELPSVPITLDIERHLRLDINAMALFQETTGKDLLSVFPQPKLGPDGKPLPLEQQPPVTTVDWPGIRAAVWAGLHWEDRELTQEDAGILMSLAPIDEIMQRLAASIEMCMPRSRGKEGKRPLERTTHLTQDPPGGGSSSSG